jgi:hypothetical protein
MAAAADIVMGSVLFLGSSETLWIALYLWLGARGRIYCTPWRLTLLRACEHPSLGLLFPVSYSKSLVHLL